MTATAISTMIVDDVELRSQPGLQFTFDPMSCDHLWEPHYHRCAYCPQCGSFARWVNDPRVTEESPNG